MSETNFSDDAKMSSTNSNSQNNHVENHESNMNGANEEHTIRRNVSSGLFSQESKPEGRVLVLYTGGTIGMVRNKDGGIYFFIFNFSFMFS